MSIDLLTDTYRKNYRVKVKLMSRILRGDLALAEDVVQEAFTRAIKYIHLYDESRGLIDTWFNSILFNTLRDTQKIERNQQELHRELKLFDVIDSISPEKWPDYKEKIFSTIKLIQNTRHRRVLELFFIYGYSTTEIAQIEDRMTQSNVTTILMRFRELLKQENIIRDI